jgi:hypothetical protein
VSGAKDQVSGVTYQVPRAKYQVPGENAVKDLSINNSQLTVPNSQFSIPCPHTITEIFMAGTEPHQLDDWHWRFALDRRNGLRAGAGCPLDFVTFQTITRYPAEAQDWARKQGVPEVPAVYSVLCPLQPDELADSTPNKMGDDLAPSAFRLHPLIFTSPDQGSVFRLSPNIPADKQKVRVSVRPAEGVEISEVSLLVNGRHLTEGVETLWQMVPGLHTFEAVGIDSAGRQIRANTVTVEVVK